MYRAFIYRVGRHLYARARWDLPNKPAINGEYWLVKQVTDRVSQDAVFLDIGTNKGDWTGNVLSAAAVKGLTVNVHAFEPCGETRQTLAKRFAKNVCVLIHETAVSNYCGTAVLYANHAGSGTNSLHPVSGDQQEAISVTTLDRFLREHGISHVAFAKIDIEGFDPLALQGAAHALAMGVFDLIQFEYNWRWILNSQNLKNVFELIKNSPYRLGKLAGERILFFDKWHFEMDRFFENNYVLVRQGGPFEKLGIEAYYDNSNVLTY